MFLPRPISDNPMLYDLSLHMGYTYDTPAHGARHIIRILPLSIPGRQRLVAGSLDGLPVPEERATNRRPPCICARRMKSWISACRRA